MIMTFFETNKLIEKNKSILNWNRPFEPKKSRNLKPSPEFWSHGNPKNWLWSAKPRRQNTFGSWLATDSQVARLEGRDTSWFAPGETKTETKKMNLTASLQKKSRMSSETVKLVQLQY